MSARINFPKNVILALIILLATLPLVASAEPYATLQRHDAALGHYARSRAMLVEALAEFEQARKIARPDMLIDPEEWRLSVISRTEELNRILDPKPRVTRGGAVFRANKLLIRRERQRPAAVENGAKDSNVASVGQSPHYLKESVKTKIENARASLGAEQEKEITDIINQPNIEIDVDQQFKEDVKTTSTEKLIEKKSPKTNKETERTLSKEEIKIEDKKVETSSALTQKPLGELPSTNTKNIVIEEESVSETKVVPADNEVQKEIKPAGEESAPDKLIVEDDEEVVGRTRQDVGTEAHEDEITRKIEKALEERMKQEQQSGEKTKAVDNGGN